MNADVMVSIHNALHSPTRIARIGRESLLVHRIDTIDGLYSQTQFGIFVVASQNLRKDSPNTRWILESPDTRQISWLTHAKYGGFHGKILTSQDNDQIHLQVLRFYPRNKTHELINQIFEVS